MRRQWPVSQSCWCDVACRAMPPHAGGSVSAGMGIYDAMMLCRSDVSTYCFGLAASMGAFLLGAGAHGKRYSMPNSRIMIHQPLGGASGQAVDIEIQVGLIPICLAAHMHVCTCHDTAHHVHRVAHMEPDFPPALPSYLFTCTGQGDHVPQGQPEPHHCGLHQPATCQG